MHTTLLIEWLLLIGASTVAARTLGRPRGWALGAACGLAWALLAFSEPNAAFVPLAWRMGMAVSGGAFVLLMAVWVSAIPVSPDDVPAHSPTPQQPPAESERRLVIEPARESMLYRSISDFDLWMERYSHDADPWPEFAEFLRSFLHKTCGGRDVHAYAVDSKDTELGSLDNGRRSCPLGSARSGITGYVLTSGRGYVASDPAAGELVHSLARKSGGDVAWSFPIMSGHRRIGVVTIGGLLGVGGKAPSSANLESAASLTSFFWRMLDAQVQAQRSAEADPGTGLLSRTAFMAAAQATLNDCYQRGEPVAVVLLAVEGLRLLDDEGQWSQVSRLIESIANILGSKCRQHDRLGRFDDGRFVMVLRRVDSELAMLILRQMMDALDGYKQRSEFAAERINFRCGVAGSGLERVALDVLIQRANQRCQEARQGGVRMISDLCKDCTGPPTAAAAGAEKGATL